MRKKDLALICRPHFPHAAFSPCGATRTNAPNHSEHRSRMPRMAPRGAPRAAARSACHAERALLVKNRCNPPPLVLVTPPPLPLVSCRSTLRDGPKGARQPPKRRGGRAEAPRRRAEGADVPKGGLSARPPLRPVCAALRQVLRGASAAVGRPSARLGARSAPTIFFVTPQTKTIVQRTP